MAPLFPHGHICRTGTKHPGTRACVAHNVVNDCLCLQNRGRRTATAPCPVSADRVDQKRDCRGVQAVCLKIGSLCHRAGHDRCCCRAEYRLEDYKTPEGHGLRHDCIFRTVEASDHGIQSSDERSCAAEHQAETNQPETGSPDTEIHHVLHQDVACVFCSRQPGFAEGKTGLHEVDQCCSDQHPCDGRYIEFHFSLAFRPCRSLERQPMK